MVHSLYEPDEAALIYGVYQIKNNTILALGTLYVNMTVEMTGQAKLTGTIAQMQLINLFELRLDTFIGGDHTTLWRLRRGSLSCALSFRPRYVLVAYGLHWKSHKPN
jgi:hypothetical protein